MTGIKLQGVGLVLGVGDVRVATCVGSVVGAAGMDVVAGSSVGDVRVATCVVRVAAGMGVVAGSGAAQAARVTSIRIVIKIVLEFVFKLTSYNNTRESIPWRRLNLRQGEQDHQMSPTVNPSGNGSSGSST